LIQEYALRKALCAELHLRVFFPLAKPASQRANEQILVFLYIVQHVSYYKTTKQKDYFPASISLNSLHIIFLVQGFSFILEIYLRKLVDLTPLDETQQNQLSTRKLE
jgi:hypothetical protein